MQAYPAPQQAGDTPPNPDDALATTGEGGRAGAAGD